MTARQNEMARLVVAGLAVVVFVDQVRQGFQRGEIHTPHGIAEWIRTIEWLRYAGMPTAVVLLVPLVLVYLYLHVKRKPKGEKRG